MAWEDEGLSVSVSAPNDLDFFKYRPSDALDVLKGVVVSEPHDSPAAKRQNTRSLFVIGDLFGVLAAVQLDDKFHCDAGEVREIPVDGNLAAELQALEPASSKRRPDSPLRIGGRKPQ